MEMSVTWYTNMGLQLGSDSGERPKTPMLRDYFKEHGKAPAIAYVSQIFKPNKYPQFTLICDGKFRVSIYETSPLYSVLFASLEEWEQQYTCLYVQVDDAEKGAFTLCIDEKKFTNWEATNWGLRVFKDELAKPIRAGKSRRGDTTSKTIQE